MKVKFVPQNVEFEIKPGQSVMHVAQDNGLYIKSVCKGVPSCAECRVRVTEGDHNVTPPGSEELSLIGTGYFIDRRRLSCQLKCFGDITVDMTEQIGKQTGLIVGRKKKLAVKDDRVEQAVARRSEEPGDSSESEDGSDAGSDAGGEAASERTQPRDVRPQREPRGPRDGRQNQNQNQNRPQPEARGLRPQGPGGSSPSPSRPGGPPQQRPAQQRPAQQSRPSSAEGPSQNAGPEGEDGQGPRKRRRRRGKGGSGSPQGPVGSGPSRPSSS